MEFRILGPFEVVQNGGSLALGGAQQRALLAVLVVHRGELLSADRLIDELWGERAPATAAKALQGYVSHLRKALGEGVIVTQGRGYVLAVDAEQVDAGQFGALAGEGRRAISRNNPARARERLGAALQLWRGEPLAEFAYEPFAQNEIARLHEAHEAALEDRIDADLALGRDTELIGEIDTLVAANPLRERLRGQLMTALYRSGRQADALAVYRQTSELLRDELGLEPGRALKELERTDDSIKSLAFAPDGTLATGTQTGKVLFWSPSSGDQTATPVSVASGAVTNIAFDSSGQRFATTADGDGMVKLWSTSTLQQEGTALNTDPATTSTIAFGPGGRLVAIDDHGNGFTWPMSLTAWERRACAVAGRNFTPQEWARFVIGHNYAEVCP